MTDMQPRLQRVIRLGGSLMCLPDLGERLQAVISEQANGARLIVCGGGPRVDLIRQHFQRGWIEERAAHWVAIDGMSQNAAMLARMSSEFTLVRSWDEIRTLATCQNVGLLDVVTFMKNLPQEVDSIPLPQSWNVTSDSIALWLCRLLKIPELQLLKSCDGPEGALTIEDARRLSHDGAVDRYFPSLFCDNVRVTWTNLRKERPQ